MAKNGAGDGLGTRLSDAAKADCLSRQCITTPAISVHFSYPQIENLTGSACIWRSVCLCYGSDFVVSSSWSQVIPFVAL